MPLANQERRELIVALNKLAAKLSTTKEIRGIGALNDRISWIVEANISQSKLSDFLKTVSSSSSP